MNTLSLKIFVGRSRIHFSGIYFIYTETPNLEILTTLNIQINANKGHIMKKE